MFDLRFYDACLNEALHWDPVIVKLRICRHNVGPIIFYAHTVPWEEQHKQRILRQSADHISDCIPDLISIRVYQLGHTYLPLGCLCNLCKGFGKTFSIMTGSFEILKAHRGVLVDSDDDHLCMGTVSLSATGAPAVTHGGSYFRNFHLSVRQAVSADPEWMLWVWSTRWDTMRYFMNDFLFISKKISLPMEVKLNFQYLISFHAAVKANCKRSFTQRKKNVKAYELLHICVCTLSCLLLFCGVNTCSLWKTVRKQLLFDRKVQLPIWPTRLRAWQAVDNQIKTYSVGHLEIDNQEKETDVTFHLQTASSQYELHEFQPTT